VKNTPSNLWISKQKKDKQKLEEVIENLDNFICKKLELSCAVQIFTRSFRTIQNIFQAEIVELLRRMST